MSSIATQFTENTTKTLKAIVRDRMAKQSVTDGTKLSDADIDAMNSDQLAAFFAKNKAKSSEIDAQQKQNYVTMGANLLIVGTTLAKSVQSASALITAGTQLSSQVTSLNPLKAPTAMKGIGSSLSNLKDFVVTTPKLVTELTVLGKAVSYVVGD